MSTLINRSYPVRTNTQRITALVASGAGIVGQAILLCIVLFGTIYVLLGAGAVYGAEGDDPIAWEECIGRGFPPGSEVCVGYIAGYHDALAIAEADKAAAEVKRLKENLEFVGLELRGRLLILRIDIKLLEEFSDSVQKALGELPANQETEMRFRTLVTLGDQIAQTKKNLVDQVEGIKQRLATVQQQLDGMQ